MPAGNRGDAYKAVRDDVSVSGVTYCNINPESYLSNFRGQCYLLCSFFVHLSGRRFL